jgi:hypothetical protein
MSSFIGWLLGPREDPEQRELDRKRQLEPRGSEHDYIRSHLSSLFDLPFDMLCAEEKRLEQLIRRGNNEGQIRLHQVRYVRQWREVHEPQSYHFGDCGYATPTAQQAAPPVINITINGGGGGYSVSAVDGGRMVESGNVRGSASDSGHQTEAVVAALMRQLGPMLTQAIGNRQAAPLQISAPEPRRTVASSPRQGVALVRKS